MTNVLLLLIVTVLVALIFDFLNGFHDAANSIATVVSTRVLSPKLAVAWAAFFNFVAAVLYKTLIFIVVAPIMGLVLGFSFMVAIFWLLRNKPPQRIDKWFRKLQLLSAAGYSLGHGGN